MGTFLIGKASMIRYPRMLTECDMCGYKQFLPKSPNGLIRECPDCEQMATFFEIEEERATPKDITAWQLGKDIRGERQNG